VSLQQLWQLRQRKLIELLLLVLLHAALSCPAESVPDNTPITVYCTKAGNSWPDSYTVKLTAAAGDSDCPGQDFKGITISTHWAPYVSVTSQTPVLVCTTQTKPFTFTADIENTAPKSPDKVDVTTAWTPGTCTTVPDYPGN
jgi:hypothetical protein